MQMVVRILFDIVAVENVKMNVLDGRKGGVPNEDFSCTVAFAHPFLLIRSINFSVRCVLYRIAACVCVCVHNLNTVQTM